MINYLIRRVFQMILVLLFSALASYILLNMAPGGPLVGLQQAQRRLTQEDLARIAAYFEMDISVPFRFSRWLIGEPRGPLTIGGRTFFADLVVGCRMRQVEQVLTSAGKYESRTVGCKPGQEVTLAKLVGRKVSRGVLFGDFGTSWVITKDRPVSDLLGSRLPRTIELMLLSYAISILIGVPLGIFSAIRQYSVFDYTVTTIAFFGQSMPTFFFALLMILLFSIAFKGLGWPYLPSGNAAAPKPYSMALLGDITPSSPLDVVLHLIMPVTVLTLFNVAGWSRFVRTSMLEVMRQDYVRTARAKGLREQVVIAKHALRNALIPFITIVVFTIPGLFAGAILTETVFNWPGMGRLYVHALNSSDYPVAMAFILITAALTVIATLTSDILYTMVDPRIRLS
jgi:peptide/nickel transport system permease protein